MSVSQPDIDRLIEEWHKVAKNGLAYFDRARETLVKVVGSESGANYEPNVLQHLPDEAHAVVPELSRGFTQLIARLIELSKSSPLVSDVDRKDLRFTLRELLAALNFRQYHHWTTNVLSDEDRVLGVELPGQREENCPGKVRFQPRNG